MRAMHPFWLQMYFALVLMYIYDLEIPRDVVGTYSLRIVLTNVRTSPTATDFSLRAFRLWLWHARREKPQPQPKYAARKVGSGWSGTNDSQTSGEQDAESLSPLPRSRVPQDH